MPQKSTKEFVYKPTQELPQLGNVKTQWDLSGLFFSSPTDERIEKIVSTVERQYKAFAKKYKNLAYIDTDATLLKSLKAYETLYDTELDKVFVYLFLCKEKNATDIEAEKVLNQLEQRVTTFATTVTFYTLAIGKLKKDRQKTILKNPEFEPYHHLLRGIFESAKYMLTEVEENILSRKSMTSRGLWIAGTEKIIGATTILVDGKEESLNGAMMELLDAPKKRRHALYTAAQAKLQELGPIAENELTALILDKKTNDELRGYKTPYAATVQSFDSSEKTLQALTETVTTTGYDLSRRYYKLKQKLNKGKRVPYIDRDDFPSRMPELPYATAVEICRDSFYDFNPMYGSIFDEMLTGGHIDVFPHAGKGGGAFCISTTNCPTLLMLNHSADFGSLRTLAHEMGHGLHAYRSKLQPVLYQDHSILTAETASTFFEAVVAHKLMAVLPERQQKIYLNALISDKISTIMMCMARYRAELEMHETVRREGAMTWQAMSAVLAKHLRDYCGPGVQIEDMDGLSVVAKTHYRRNFYQYSYVLGAIVSGLMFTRCLAEESYKGRVDAFLQAGERNTVEKLFKEIDIDVTKTTTLQAGLDLLEQEITLLQKLTT